MALSPLSTLVYGGDRDHREKCIGNVFEEEKKE